MRTWNDVTGRFSVKAKVVRIKDGKAFLAKADSNVVPVPLVKLSTRDRRYVDSLNNGPTERGRPASPPGAATESKFGPGKTPRETLRSFISATVADDRVGCLR